MPQDTLSVQALVNTYLLVDLLPNAILWARRRRLQVASSDSLHVLDIYVQPALARQLYEEVVGDFALESSREAS